MQPLLTALALAALPALPRPDQLTVRWKDKDVQPDAIATELGPQPRAAVESWAPYALEHGYRMFLTEDGRVLLLAPERNKSARDERGLIEKTCKYVDAILPAPAEEEPEPQPEPPADGGGEGEGAWETTWSWGAGEWRRDAETAVLVQARNAEDYAAAVESLAQRFDYLRGWVDSAKQYTGASLEAPLAAIWLLADDDLEEWNPRNELVHRLATLLVLRRFDRQPAWILQGLAWHVEHELLGAHYCFPWRHEYVYEVEHTRWAIMLRDAHAQTDELRMQDVAALSRGDFRIEHAQNAWGAMTFLVREHPVALPAFLESVRALQAEQGVIHHDDGTWETVPGYEPSPEDQLRLLREAAGEDVLVELLAHYRSGKAGKR
jgi:hypothetical protein